MIDHTPLPFSEDPIFVDWFDQKIGGLRVSAWTDQSGNPYMGVFTLNRLAKPNGLPCWYERSNFMSPIVIGFDSNDHPIKVFLDAGITARGLHAALHLPWEPRALMFYHERLFARWGSEAPSFGFMSLASPSSETASYVLSRTF